MGSEFFLPEQHVCWRKDENTEAEKSTSSL